MTDFPLPHDRREFLLHYARVNITEARRELRQTARRVDRAFARHLIGSASMARREAASIDVTPPQRDLFGGSA